MINSIHSNSMFTISNEVNPVGQAPSYEQIQRMADILEMTQYLNSYESPKKSSRVYKVLKENRSKNTPLPEESHPFASSIGTEQIERMVSLLEGTYQPASEWSAEELIHLHCLKKEGYSFEEISKELPNRTSSECEEIFAQLTFSTRKCRQSWSQAQEKFLLTLVASNTDYEVISQVLNHSQRAWKKRYTQLTQPK